MAIQDLQDEGDCFDSFEKQTFLEEQEQEQPEQKSHLPQGLLLIKSFVAKVFCNADT
jgi:hypothetical protein